MMNDLPPLPVSSKAIEIALNGMAMGILFPAVWRALIRPRTTILDCFVIIVWATSSGLFFSNLALWITRALV